MRILWDSESDVFMVQKGLFFYIKRRKSVFHDSFLRFITWAYMGLQWVTGGYKGLQKICFLTSTSPDTSWAILHTNQS